MSGIATKRTNPARRTADRAIERTGYDASLLGEFLGPRKLANLRKLIEMARQFDQGHFFTLKDFVTRLQTSVLEETDEEFATTLPESGDVIRLMSIHQSKGLEFPIVIVADIDRKGPPQGSGSGLHPQLGPLVKPPEKFGVRAPEYRHRHARSDRKEGRCRRNDSVVLCGLYKGRRLPDPVDGPRRRKPTNSPWFQLIESRFDIGTGLLKTDPLLGSSESGTAATQTIPEILVHRPSEAKLPDAPDEKQIPLSQLARTILAAEPGEFPASAASFLRNASDIATISVSRSGNDR